MRSPITAERRSRILEILMQDGSLRINDIAEKFQVSSETVRKDLLYLEKKGMAKKSHGGALATSETIVRHIAARSVQNLDAKNRIARKAMEYIPENGVILLDPGSTTGCVAKLLCMKSGLTIITNSISVATALSESNNRVYLTGGEVRGNTLSLIGMWTTSALGDIRPNVAIMGSSGFSSFGGPTSETFAEAEVKRLVVEYAAKSVVIADSTKFDSAGLCAYADWKEIDVLITDSAAPLPEVEELREKTKVILAE